MLHMNERGQEVIDKSVKSWHPEILDFPGNIIVQLIMTIIP